MTRRQDLEHHRHSLGEIREIMNSMKTLAYMETRKLSRFLNAQHAAVRSIEDTAADFLSFHPETLPEVDETTRVYLLIGTERGFCGDFNQTLVRDLESTLETHPVGNPLLIAVGRKLHTLIENDARVTALIDGAGVVEEIAVVLNQMVRALSSLQEQHGMLTVYGLYHSGHDGIVMQKLLPSFQRYLHQPPRFPHPPVLNLSPTEFLRELTEQYLFAALHEMLYTSLMAENHNRVAHLEGAVKHLDDKSDELARQCNALRQEEIIEEIEVILLSAGNIDEDWRQHKSLRTKYSVKAKNSRIIDGKPTID
ncbi:MAG: F0F1 ATP synthase subunit gamma [Desulfuromonadales bacterium]|nr:F0F1 ATP synthase subunit gamma [Chloroflexota bacterium]MCK4622217.1 F0F1 ATP synthase subunit gamma [Desulfuromonadales bacterium]